MYPNPQSALPLPPHASLERYRKFAKDLVKACKSGNPDAFRAWAARWLRSLFTMPSLGITELPARYESAIDQLAEFARAQLSGSNPSKAACVLADAQFVIARVLGFESWPKFATHVEGMARANGPVFWFEIAATSIAIGDVEALKFLLREHPALVRERSTREHRATLLHYVSANGIEDYRQRTPPNAVEIAETLLQAGAEVDAEAEVYGGGATTLGLVATSVHPERAGVQEKLMALLLRHGANVNHAGPAGKGRSIVNACLANGRRKAAEFLAQHGAILDLEAAAGLGRLDIVQSYFDEDVAKDRHSKVGNSTLKDHRSTSAGLGQSRLEGRGFDPAASVRPPHPSPLPRPGGGEGVRRTGEGAFTAELKPAPFPMNDASLHNQALERGFLWACEYGRNDVVDYLLSKGIDPNAQANTGQTGLQWAVIGGQLETIKLLIERGASLETRNTHGGTPLGQAIWSALNSDAETDYLAVIKLLLEAGATIEDDTLDWLAEREKSHRGARVGHTNRQIAYLLRRHRANA